MRALCSVLAGEFEKLSEVSALLAEMDPALATKARRIAEWKLGRVAILELVLELLPHEEILSFLCWDHDTATKIPSKQMKVNSPATQLQLIEECVGPIRRYAIAYASHRRLVSEQPEEELNRQLRMAARLVDSAAK